MTQQQQASLVMAIEERRDELIALTQDLVRMPTLNPPGEAYLEICEYLAARLRQAGFELAYPERRATHEFIVTLKRQAREFGVNAMDFAKRLLDYGFHAPTTYFPLLVPECLLIEPTETEPKEALDGFADAMGRIEEEARTRPEYVHGAPYTTPVRRLDDVKAARELDLGWKEDSSAAAPDPRAREPKPRVG